MSSPAYNLSLAFLRTHTHILICRRKRVQPHKTRKTVLKFGPVKPLKRDFNRGPSGAKTQSVVENCPCFGFYLIQFMSLRFLMARLGLMTAPLWNTV